MKRFTITEDHLKLLRRMYIGWDHCEFGAPAVDCKRPYGNSDVLGDMREILGWEHYCPECGEQYADCWDHAPADEDKLRALHADMADVLQIGVAVGYFQAGDYCASEYGIDWRPA